MSDVVIRVENLGKLYRIGEQERYKALRDTLTDAFAKPFRLFRDLFSGNGDSPPDLSDNTIWALKDVSFEVKRGEVIGIIGRNGAGKSTLLKILSRITEPTTGRAEIRGRVGSLLEVGTGFHPELTGRENIYLNGAILGMRKAELARKFDEIVDFAEVEKFIDTPVKHYSSGMYLRLAFAVAAHLEPEILLVDEVLAVGDAAFQKKCLGKMGDVAKEGRTVLFISHNMAAIRSLCLRAILLSEGQVHFSGQTNQCIDKYLFKTIEDMPAEIDTSNILRPSAVSGDATLRITRVKIDSPSGSAIFHTGQPMAIVLEFQSILPLSDVVLGWAVHSSDQVRVFECRTLDAYGPISHLQPGRYSIMCTVPSNPLNSGFYTLHVGSRCAQKGLDYLPDVLIFQVDNTKRFNNIWLEAPSGLIRMSSNWTNPISI